MEVETDRIDLAVACRRLDRECDQDRDSDRIPVPPVSVLAVGLLPTSLAFRLFLPGCAARLT